MKKISLTNPLNTDQNHTAKKNGSLSDVAQFEHLLTYQFNDSSLLEEAFRHSSFVNEQPELGMRDNERLEFLGDAVLNLVVGHMLMDRYPDLKEGDLSRTRAGLVNESQLAEIASKLDVGTFIRLGKGERQTDGMKKNSILANTLEAIIAAIYLDGGLDAACHVIDTHFPMLSEPVVPQTSHHDYKSRLQELVQTRQNEIPLYNVTDETGPDHDKTFSVQLTVCGISAKGEGKSKKLAEQDAAKKAFELLSEEKSDD